jgi:hypothetical protein
MIITGAVIWVDSVGGSAGGAGTYEDPVDDLAQAVSNATASNGDVIVIKSGHTETLTSAITISKAGLTIFGLGSGSSAPNFLCNAAIVGIDLAANGLRVYNLYFPVGTTTGNSGRIKVNGTNAIIKSCTFMCGQYDQNSIVVADAGDDCMIDSCTFTVSANGPDSAILVESANTYRLTVKSSTFNGASISWDNGAIYSAVAHLDWMYLDNTLNDGADIIHTAASKGIISGTVADDECQVSV